MRLLLSFKKLFFRILRHSVDVNGHIVITAAFSRAQVSVLAPFEYTSLIWAAIIGYLVWGNFPSLHMWFGATIIVASGLYVINRESIKSNDKPVNPGLNE